MKKIILFAFTLIFCCIAACSSKIEEKDASVNQGAGGATTESSKISGEPCDISFGNVHFTKSINGADTLAVEQNNGRIAFKVGEKKDYFNDPNGKLSNNTAPILLSKIDNTKPFTLVSKVTPGFTAEGMYNAGVLYLYVNDNLWQKHCFEQDERGKHRVVTVRTINTSDDNNHDVIESPSVYLKISSDTKTVASYYSLDKETWHLVRLYQNAYPEDLWVGISSQCPVDRGTTNYFEEISLELSSVKDFRMGI
ncbi:DUF1349 domain-containing protein [Pontibacter sp. 13R65]|uniref:DUF1349 domain-containing protein n=1 Tax=Pontibacter sp. 13R65 TaxID=3127458 RepID=UPI00301C4F27